jgi:hypothetical protein
MNHQGAIHIMSDIIECTTPGPASQIGAEAPCPHLLALRGCMRHEGPPLTPGQIDLLIEASVMEEFMTSMGWDPTSVVSAADWPPLEDMPYAGGSANPLFGCLAQVYREQGVEFYVPSTDFFRPLAAGQPGRRQG